MKENKPGTVKHMEMDDETVKQIFEGLLDRFGDNREAFDDYCDQVMEVAYGRHSDVVTDPEFINVIHGISENLNPDDLYDYLQDMADILWGPTWMDENGNPTFVPDSPPAN